MMMPAGANLERRDRVVPDADTIVMATSPEMGSLFRGPRWKTSKPRALRRELWQHA
jgi:hypothetical protein